MIFPDFPGPGIFKKKIQDFPRLSRRRGNPANRGEGIVSTNPRPKSVYDFLGSVYGFVVLRRVCDVARPYVI